MSAKYIELKEIISEFLDQENKSIGDFDKAWIIAFRILELMHFSTTAEPKTVRIPVQGNKTVVLPADYVSWTKVGLLNEHNEIIPLVINNQLTLFRDLNPNRESYLTKDIKQYIFGFPYFFNYFFDNNFYNLNILGLGAPIYGECRVDETNNVIVLNPHFKYQHIMLEYLSTPEKDGDYKVDRRLREALIAGLSWKFKIGSRQEFYAAWTESRRMIHPVTPQEYERSMAQYTGVKIRFW
jgi:hypothetical protein